MVRHVVADDARTLVYLADQGCLTPHVWLSRADAPDVPDRLVFDLDPPSDGDDHVENVRWAARRLRALLGDLGVRSRLMTSGSRGLHVHVALKAVSDFELTRALARRACELLAARHPERLTTAQRKAERRGRLFLDYLRNGYAQTSVPPYAVRARPGAPVATPVEWDELAGLDPGRYTVRNVFRRLGQPSDPWKDIDEDRVRLDEASRRLDELVASGAES